MIYPTLAEAANIGPPATLVVGAVAAVPGSIGAFRPAQSRPASRQAP